MPGLLRAILITATAAAAGLWALTAADTRLSERGVDVFSAAAVTLTVTAAAGWITLLRRNRELEMIISAAVEARKPAAKDGKDPSGPLRRVQ